MEHRATLAARLLRAGLLAAVVMVAGSLAHTSAEGAMPGPVGLVVLHAAATAAAACFLAREASALRLVTLTAGGQTAVHCALSAMAGHGTPPTAGHAGMHHVHADAGMHHAGSGSGLPSWLTHAIDGAVDAPLMAMTHLAAAVVVGLWLAVGERMLWSLVRLLGSRAALRLAVALSSLGLQPVVLGRLPRTPGVRPRRTTPRPQLPVWSRGPVRRGPPVGVLPH